MAQGAVLYRWGQVVPGREQMALGLFQENVEMLDDFAKNNMIIGHYPYVSTNRDGGYWVVHGEMEQLGAIQMMPEVQALQAKVQLALTDWSAEWLVGGSAEELGGQMAMYGEILNDLA